jgi:oligopeptidase A
MFESAEELEHFLIELRLEVRPRAQLELEEVWRFARSQGAPKEFRPWDLPYWAEKLREHHFGDLDGAWRRHLPAARAVETMVHCAGELFGVQLEPMDPARAGDRRFAVRSAEGSRVAVDVSWPPENLTHDQLRAVFRAFGGDLHRALAPSVDAYVEECSAQAMESWCYHPPTLARICGGNQPPDALVEKTRAARRFLAALRTTDRLEPAFFDLRVHRDYVPGSLSSPLRSQVLDTFAQVRREVGVLPPPPWNRRASSLVEVFGGGGQAGYGALWADVVAAELFQAFEESDPDDGAARRRGVARQLLSASAPTLYEAFRGQRPSIAAWLGRAGLGGGG